VISAQTKLTPPMCAEGRPQIQCCRPPRHKSPAIRPGHHAAVEGACCCGSPGIRARGQEAAFCCYPWLWPWAQVRQHGVAVTTPGSTSGWVGGVVDLNSPAGLGPAPGLSHRGKMSSESGAGCASRGRSPARADSAHLIATSPGRRATSRWAIG